MYLIVNTMYIITELPSFRRKVIKQFCLPQIIHYYAFLTGSCIGISCPVLFQTFNYFSLEGFPFLIQLNLISPFFTSQIQAFYFAVLHLESLQIFFCNFSSLNRVIFLPLVYCVLLLSQTLVILFPYTFQSQSQMVSVPGCISFSFSFLQALNIRKPG